MARKIKNLKELLGLPETEEWEEVELGKTFKVKSVFKKKVVARS